MSFLANSARGDLRILIILTSEFTKVKYSSRRLKRRKISFVLSERVWELQKVNLKNFNNHTAAKNVADQGLLIITVKNKLTGMEQNGLACVEYFDSKTASMFCQFRGFTSGWLEKNLKKGEKFQ